MIVRIILGVIFWPYGLFLVYKHLIKGDSLNKTVSEENDIKRNSTETYELSDIEKKYFIPSFDTTKKEILSNLEKGVYIPVDKLFKSPKFNDKSLNKLYNNNLTQKAMQNLYSRDLLLLSDKLIVTNSNSLMGKVGSLTGSGESELYYDQITSVKFKTCNKVTNGHISFAFAGKEDSGTGLTAIVKGGDPYSVPFFESLNKIMSTIKEIVQEKSREKDSKQVVNQVDVTLQIEKLNELKEKGIITEEEFVEKKKILLDKI